ncbi:Rve domain containing hypothetical protein [Phytophthora palmivora]|uniref:Retroviral polymerase SH3-like domain-containing protein n=1 Tax=Phytophthora palmivora TaxID=4796 RepID=A0A2P4XTI8_9STRA|nr:Rve domain containing hypothetical protein [Phytophthora palmivora]
MTTVHIVNRIPNSARPQVTIVVVAGIWIIHVDKAKRVKLDAKAHRCLFLGFTEGSNAYRVWDYDEMRLVTTRTVKLDECEPSQYCDAVPQVQAMSIFPIDDDNDMPLPVSKTNPDNAGDVKTEDVTAEDTAAEMDVDTPSFHDALVPTMDKSLTIPERGSKESFDRPRVVCFQYNDVITDAVRHVALPFQIPVIRSSLKCCKSTSVNHFFIDR